MLFYILTIVCIVILVKLIIDYSESEYVTSTVNGKKYLVRNLDQDHSHNLETANTLAILNERCQLLIDTLSGPNEMYFVSFLRRNYKGNPISEAAIDHNQTSFTINKQNIHICIRSRDHKRQVYDINDLMYVVLHELGHMCNYTKNGDPIEGHGPEFKIKFRFLVNEAIKMNLYKYHDYTNNPKNYCGMKITSNIID